jgi:ketosteroid isomerase-like protein
MIPVMQQTATYADVFADVDRMDAKAFASHLTDDCVLRFGNADELVGRQAIEEAIDGFFGTIKGLSHRIVDEWELGDTAIVQTETTYTRLDDGQVTLPAVVVARRDGDRFGEYRIFTDLAPIYA